MEKPTVMVGPNKPAIPGHVHVHVRKQKRGGIPPGRAFTMRHHNNFPFDTVPGKNLSGRTLHPRESTCTCVYLAF